MKPEIKDLLQSSLQTAYDNAENDVEKQNLSKIASMIGITLIVKIDPITNLFKNHFNT